MTRLMVMLRMLYARARHVKKTSNNILEREKMPFYSRARTTFSTFGGAGRRKHHNFLNILNILNIPTHPRGQGTKFAGQACDTQITGLAEQGKSQREIAPAVGVVAMTVNRALAVPERNTVDVVQHDPAPVIHSRESGQVEAGVEQPEQKEPLKSRGVGVKYAHDVKKG